MVAEERGSDGSGRHGQLLIIGIDGGTFDVIKPMVKKGKLPNISGLMETGAYGELSSTIPPFTPIAWTTMLTGKNAGKHGIMNFRRFNLEKKSIEFINGGSIKEKTIFDLASEAGKKCVMINIPMTYPPHEVNGICVSGMDAPPGSVYTYPAELTEELNKKGYTVDLDFGIKYSASKDAYLSDLVKMEETRKKASLELLSNNPWDLAMVVFVITDRIQHSSWNNREYLEKAYSTVDSAIGELVERFPKATVLLVSDHGAGPIKTGVSINKWLMSEGYLTLKERKLVDSVSFAHGGKKRIVGEKGKVKGELFLSSPDNSLVRKAISSIDSYLSRDSLKISLKKKNTFACISFDFDKNKKLRVEVEAKGSKDKMGLQIGGFKEPIVASSFLTQYFKRYAFNVPSGPIEIVFSTFGEMPTGDFSVRRISFYELDANEQLSKEPIEVIQDVDWKKTRAFAFGYYGSITINREALKDSETEKLKNEIAEKLRSLENPENSESIISEIYRREELFSGPLVSECPDLLALPNPVYYTVDGFGGFEDTFICPIPRDMVGAHRINGMFLLANGSFQKKEMPANISEIAPTALYLLGLPIPSDFDGNVMGTAFQDSFLEKNPIRRTGVSAKKTDTEKIYSSEDTNAIENRLKDLGYID